MHRGVLCTSRTHTCLAELDRCAEMLSQVGTGLALEFAAYGGLTRLADAVSLCQELGWNRCGVLVDTWHFFRTDAPWDVLRSLAGEQIAFVHVNDGAAVPGEDAVQEGRFARLPVGMGAFPLAEFAAVLDEAGYVGPLSTEVLSDDVRNRVPEEGARLLFARYGTAGPEVSFQSRRDRASRGRRRRLPPRPWS